MGVLLSVLRPQRGIYTSLSTIPPMGTHVHSLPLLLIPPPLLRPPLLSSGQQPVVESRRNVRGMHLQYPFKLMRIGF